MKEFRVYLVDVNKSNINTTNINDWNSDDQLSDNALAFIEHAEKSGRVFSIKGFQNVLNDNSEINLNYDFVFITNKY